MTHCMTEVVLPTPFRKFCNYNDYKKKKEKKPHLTQEGLNHHVQLLSEFLMQPWFCHSRYSELYNATEKLVEGIRKYQMYLQDNSVRNTRQQHSPELIRSPVDNVIMKTIPANNDPVSSDYIHLFKALDESPYYQHVFLNDFAPEDRFERRKWIGKLQLPVTIFMYRYPHGNNLGTLTFVWKVPHEIDHTQNQCTITQLNN